MFRNPICRTRHFASIGRPSIVDSIGGTPLVELPSLSRLTGCTVLAKCEHLNPGGSIKDRAARGLVRALEASGELRPGDTLVEGGGGNTGIGLALVASAKGYRTVQFVPAATSVEKLNAMKFYGAQVVLTPPVPFSDSQHYFHQAAELGQKPKHVWTNQFENLANSQAHYDGTSLELWEATHGSLDGFICSCGTGGTIGGIATRLKQLNPAMQCWIIDPPGSALAPLMQQGESYIQPGTSVSSGRTAYRADDVVRYIARSPAGIDGYFEGIGIDRVTANFGRAFDAAALDGALAGTELEAARMAWHLARHEGLAVGPSAALNVVGAVKLALALGRGKTVATVICDGAERYSKQFNAEWLEARALSPDAGLAGWFRSESE